MRWEDRLLVHMRDTALTLLFSMCVHCLRSQHTGTRHHSSPLFAAAPCVSRYLHWE